LNLTDKQNKYFSTGRREIRLPVLENSFISDLPWRYNTHGPVCHTAVLYWYQDRKGCRMAQNGCHVFRKSLYHNAPL